MRLALLGLAVGLVSTEGAVAQRKPGERIEQKLRPGTAWKSRGELGRGYRPRSVGSYHSTARTHARTLNRYGHMAGELPSATAREHLSAIRANVEKSHKELGKLGPDLLEDEDVKMRVEKLRKQYASILAQCKMMDHAIDEEDVDEPLVCKHCVNVEKALDAVAAEHQRLLDLFGIELDEEKSQSRKPQVERE